MPRHSPTAVRPDVGSRLAIVPEVVKPVATSIDRSSFAMAQCFCATCYSLLSQIRSDVPLLSLSTRLASGEVLSFDGFILRLEREHLTLATEYRDALSESRASKWLGQVSFFRSLIQESRDYELIDLKRNYETLMGSAFQYINSIISDLPKFIDTQMPLSTTKKKKAKWYVQALKRSFLDGLKPTMKALAAEFNELFGQAVLGRETATADVESYLGSYQLRLNRFQEDFLDNLKTLFRLELVHPKETVKPGSTCRP